MAMKKTASKGKRAKANAKDAKKKTPSTNKKATKIAKTPKKAAAAKIASKPVGAPKAKVGEKAARKKGTAAKVTAKPAAAKKAAPKKAAKKGVATRIRTATAKLAKSVGAIVVGAAAGAAFEIGCNWLQGILIKWVSNHGSDFGILVVGLSFERDMIDPQDQATIRRFVNLKFPNRLPVWYLMCDGEDEPRKVRIERP